MTRRRGYAVALFYVLACLWSWPLFVWRDLFSWSGFPAPPAVGTALIMWGPGIAALVCYRLLRADVGPRTVTLLGTSGPRAVVAVSVVYVLDALVHGPADWRTAPVLASFVIFRTLGEELGWRGFLQDALRPVPLFARFALVGVLWEVWHLHRVGHLLSGRVTMLLVAVAASVVIGLAVERTRSLLVAVAFHDIMNAGFESLDAGGLRDALVAVAALGLVLMVLAGWPKRRATREEDAAVPTGAS